MDRFRFHNKIKRMSNYVAVNNGISNEKPALRNNSIVKNISLSNTVIINNNLPVSIDFSINRYYKTTNDHILTPGTMKTTSSRMFTIRHSRNSNDPMRQSGFWIIWGWFLVICLYFSCFDWVHTKYWFDISF